MNKKILILTSDTGGGHTSAARAIEAGITKVATNINPVHIARVMEECSRLIHVGSDLYNFLLRYHQRYVKHYHWLINRFNLAHQPAFYRLYNDYFLQLLDRHCPNVIVSVHPMMQYAIGRILEDLKLTGKVPLVTVVTDPCGNSWNGWKGDQVDLYIVAHERAKEEMMSLGIAEDRIRICGMPIHPKFQDVSQRDPAIARRELGLDPGKFTLFVNAGWVGGGNIPKIYRSLVDADLDLQVIFLAGRNRRLEKEAYSLAKRATFPIKVLGYTDRMDQLMSASDLLVSKLGGLTTFEALASHLPIIADTITPPMPQEAGTAQLIEEANAGILLKRPQDIVPIVQGLTRSTTDYFAMKRAAAALGKPDATQRIVDEINALA